MPLYTPTPDATDTVKGKLQLTNDLGGTADLPTTPTAVHITGDETAEGAKTWTGKTYRQGGLAVPGTFLNAFAGFGTTTAIFANVSARSTYVYNNDDFPVATTPFYVKNETTGEIFKVNGDSGFTWSNCERGLFGTAPSKVTIGDVFTLQATGDYATYMSPDYERVNVDCTGGLMEVILPDITTYPTMEDDLTLTICDYIGSLGNGNALMVTDPTNGNRVSVWDKGAMVRVVYDGASGLWNFLSTKSLASDYASPAKYSVRLATTSALSVSSYSFPNLNLSSAVFSLEGITLLAGDLILVKDQATASQNGVYTFNTSTQLIRASDFQTGQNYVPSLPFYVAEGTINGDSSWVLTANDPITLDTTSLTFRRSGGTQSVSSKTANYTITNADDGAIISYTTLAAARTVTLPALSAVPEGFRVTVADGTSGTHASTNNITITRAGADVFVDGATSKTLNVAGGYMTFTKANGLWIVAESGGTNIREKLQLGTAYGSTTVPTLHGFDTDTGISWTNNNIISFMAASVTRATLSNTYLRMTVPIEYADGTAGAPSVTNTGDTDTGVYFPNADEVGVSAGGTLRLTIGATAITSTLPVYAVNRYYLTNSGSNYPGAEYYADTDTGFVYNYFYRKRTTGSGQTLSGDVLGAFGFRGHNGTAYTTANDLARIIAYTAEDTTSIAGGAHLDVAQNSVGSLTPTTTWRFAAGGILQSRVTGTAGGLTFGTGATQDVNLYRSAADILKTDDKLHVVGELELDGDLNHDGTNVGFFGVAPVTRPTELTDELTTVTHTAPVTPDYAISAPVDSSGGANFGFASADEFNTVMSVIANLQIRNKELEDKLTSLGLLQDAD